MRGASQSARYFTDCDQREPGHENTNPAEQDGEMWHTGDWLLLPVGVVCVPAFLSNNRVRLLIWSLQMVISRQSTSITGPEALMPLDSASNES